MTTSGSLHSIAPPVEATALLADLRNFTPLLNGCPRDDQGISRFCGFLGDSYSIILDSCLTALPPGMRSRPPIHINSTGDGALAVFTGKWHFGFGYLAAILLDTALARACERFNMSHFSAGLPKTSYGIGVESGSVVRIRALSKTRADLPTIDAFIGQCINVAARAEGITKTLYGANTVFSDEIVELVAQALFGENLVDKRAEELKLGDGPDEERSRLHKSMNDLNRKLCIAYINRHLLKGVDQPMPLYRLSRSSLNPDVTRFRELATRLTCGDADHRDEVLDWVRGREREH